MVLEIIPHVGVGPIRFGMGRDEVQSAVGSSPSSFRRTSASTNDTDAFDAEGIYVSYDADDKCEAVEMASPANPIINGRRLVGVPYKDLKDWLEGQDPNTKTDEAGLTSIAFGLGLYAPYAEKAPSEPVESVIVFRRGYYD